VTYTQYFDAATQAQQVGQAIAQNPAAVVSQAADTTTLPPMLQQLKAKHIPVVILNALPPQQGTGSLYAAFYGADPMVYGQQAVQALLAGLKAKNLPASGDILLITGPPGTPPADGKTQGFETALAKDAPGIKIVGTEPGNWDTGQAQTAAAGLFTAHQDAHLIGVYAENDDMAQGVVLAAKQAGVNLSKMVLIGSDCNQNGINNINSGVQYASVLENPIAEGNGAAQEVINILNGKKQTQDQYGPDTVITAKNVSVCQQIYGK
jgi:ABC-type sugar transport system substrate-binding protein